MRRPPVVSDAVKRGLTPLHRRQSSQLLPRTRMGGPMPWIIAIMVALVVLAAGGALALGKLADSARGELAGAATVQIVEADPATRATQVERAVAALREDPAVVSVRAVPEEEIEALLQPWLGDLGTGSASAVPVPALIDIQLSEIAGDAELARLSGLLERAAPDARLNAQSDWLGPVFGAIASIQWLALILALMLAFTGITAVWLAARNALAANAKTIEVVHLLGGDDHQIARVVQRAMRTEAVLGSAAGFVIGAAALLFLGSQFAALDSGLVAGGGIGWSGWVILALIPLLGAFVALLTARLTVLYLLRKIA